MLKGLFFVLFLIQSFSLLSVHRDYDRFRSEFAWLQLDDFSKVFCATHFKECLNSLSRVKRERTTEHTKYCLWCSFWSLFSQSISKSVAFTSSKMTGYDSVSMASRSLYDVLQFFTILYSRWNVLEIKRPEKSRLRWLPTVLRLHARIGLKLK